MGSFVETSGGTEAVGTYSFTRTSDVTTLTGHNTGDRLLNINGAVAVGTRAWFYIKNGQPDLYAGTAGNVRATDVLFTYGRPYVFEWDGSFWFQVNPPFEFSEPGRSFLMAGT